MATYTASTYAFDMSVTANYQTLMGDVDSHIQSLGGWTYVSQTGDANPASTAPGSAATYPAFRCYSTTSGANTWYLRLDYGHTTNGPSIKVQLGTSLNGSGTLGGQTSTQVTMFMSSTNTGTGQTLHMAAATGRLMVYLALGSANRNIEWGFSIHAAVDTGGAGSGNMEFYTGINTAFTSQALPFTGTVPTQLSNWPAPFGTASSQAFGGVTPLGIPVAYDTGGAYNPSLAGFVYGGSDLTANTVTTVSLYGTTRSYIVTPLTSPTGAAANSVFAAFRYD